MTTPTSPCPGCTATIAENQVACPPCYRRLPRDLRTALKTARRRRHDDNEPWGDAAGNAREWLTQRRKETP